MIYIMFFLLILIKKGVYNQSYIEKEIFLLETFKEKGCNFVKTLENFYFKLWCIMNLSQKIR